jgi:hypothetical protein
MLVHFVSSLMNLSRPTGEIFSVPRHNVRIDPQPSKGDIVTFSYAINARRELPINPEITRIRTNITWTDIIASNGTEEKFLNGICGTNSWIIVLTQSLEQLHIKRFTTQSQGYWTAANMRLFMETFAKSFNLDPLLAETWYKIPPKIIYQLKVRDAYIFAPNSL